MTLILLDLFNVLDAKNKACYVSGLGRRPSNPLDRKMKATRFNKRLFSLILGLYRLYETLQRFISYI